MSVQPTRTLSDLRSLRERARRQESNKPVHSVEPPATLRRSSPKAQRSYA
jgi:hypothetical protein